ncbi:unnamed protein product [Anisakis simplex]|uniref:BHLH domain-containing protein n=1 Tax=Anisakis simplex TaxID=6269 RepID=A0A0M3K7B6_ANISI|nr:unnamed protein product [Anisakis simplex]
MSTTSSPSSSTSASNSECSDPPSSRRRRIAKMSQERRERKATLAKLQRIVPYAHEGLSQLELLQRIIDYIADLQVIILLVLYHLYKIVKIFWRYLFLE